MSNLVNNNDLINNIIKLGNITNIDDELLNIDLLNDKLEDYQYYKNSNFDLHKYLKENKYFNKEINKVYNDLCKKYNEHNLNIKNKIIVKDRILTSLLLKKLNTFAIDSLWKINKENDNILYLNCDTNIILHKIFYKYIEKSLNYNEKLKISSINLINYEHGKSSNFIIEKEENLNGPIILINLNYDWDTLYEGNLIMKNIINNEILNYQLIPGQVKLLEPYIIYREEDLSVYAKISNKSKLILEYKTYI